MIWAAVRLDAGCLDAVETFLYEHPDGPWALESEGVTGEWWLIGFFPGENNGREAMKKLTAAVEELDPRTTDWSFREVEDEEWRFSYRQHIHRWECGRLVWLPAWEAPREEDRGRAVIKLDSGMAFGTGSHETTRLCATRLVEFCETHGAANRKVVDAGCGSGILALSACALGVPEVSGFDLDPEAVRISRENAEANGMSRDVVFTVADLPQGLEQCGSADLLLANIETHILRRYATCLLQGVKSGGELVLSGILSTDADSLQEHFEKIGREIWGHTPVIRTRRLGEWSDLCASRRGRSPVGCEEETGREGNG